MQKSKQIIRWKEVELGDVGTFLRGPFGSAIKKSVCVPKGKDTFKLYEQGNVINNNFERGEYYINKEKFEELKKFELLPGDIAITCAGTLGRIAIVPENIEKGIINSVLMRIRLDHSKINSKYFIYLFKTPAIQNKITSHSQGAAIKNLFATKELKSFKFLLPPLQVQKQIILILEKAEELKQKRKNADKLTKEYLQGVFYDIFGDPVKNEKGWRKEDLLCTCYLKGRIGWRGLSQKDYRESGPLLLTGENLINLKIDLSSVKHITQDRYDESSEIMLKNGDILLSKDGTIGKLGIVENLNEKATIGGTLALIRPLDKDKLINYFVLYQLSLPSIQNIYKENTYGASIPHIFQRDLKKVKLIVPPLQLQQNFVSVVKQVEKLKEKQKQSKEEINLMFDSLMKQAFNGG